MGKGVDYSILKELWEKNYTITTQLYRNLQKWPDKPAIIDPLKRTMTFRQWDEEANQFAHALLDAGCTTFDTVMGDLYNCCEWFTLYMGAAKARCIFASQNSMLPEGRSPDSWMIVR